MDSHGRSSQSYQYDIDTLTQEIEFQMVLLESIEEDPLVDNREEAKAEVRNEIQNLRNQLEILQDKERASNSRQDSRAGSSSKVEPRWNDPADSASPSDSDADLDLDPFSRNRPTATSRKMKQDDLPEMSLDSDMEISVKVPTIQNGVKVNHIPLPDSLGQDHYNPPSLSSTMSVTSTPTSNTTDSTGDRGSPKKMDLPTRKRSHSTHIGFLEPTASNKTRRTTPSPLPTRSPTPISISSGDEDFAAFDNKYFPDANRVAQAKMKQEKDDEEFARRLGAQFAAEAQAQSSNPSSFKSAFDRISGPRPFGSQSAASSSRNLPWKTEPKFENKSKQKLEKDGRSMMAIPKFGASQMPRAFAGSPYDDDSDVEIIDASAFRDNGRNSAGKVEPSDALKLAMYGKKGVRDWMSPPQSKVGLPNGIIPAIGSVYNPAPSFDAQMPGAFPEGSMHNPISHLGVFTNGIKQQDSSDYDSDDMDDMLRANMESGLDMHGNPLQPGMQAQYNYVINDPRKTDEEIRALLANIRPDEDLPKEDREGTPEAMAYPLYEHQKLALTWLKKMEESKTKGGILADDMGLGKTISALALIVSRPPTDRAKRTTLIVAPVALVRQWEREIKMKLKPAARLSVLNMHGKKQTWDTIRTYDVVLTTYGTIGAEFKRYEKYSLKKLAEKEPMDNNEMMKICPLFSLRTHFHRIILDEAQCIKNKATRAALACHTLKATYRLVLTGTPMMNNPGELFSLIKFLRIKPYDEWTRFQDSFRVLSKGSGQRGGNPKKALEKLQILLKAILLRRTKSSLIDGQPIINLPPKTEEIQHVIFDEDEQAFYKALESKTQLQFNKYMKAGTVGKNYSNVLVLLLRLRQACCHPHLIQDFETAPGAMDSDAMLELAKALSPDVIARIIAAEGAFDCPICYDGVANPSILIPCGHSTCTECLSRVTDQAAQDNHANDAHRASKCPTCRAEIDTKKVIDYTTFKKVHEPNEDEIETASEHSDSEDSDLDSGSETDSDEEEDEDSGEDVDSDGDLKDFIVPDGLSDTEDEDEGVVDKKEDLVDDEDDTTESDSDIVTAKQKSKGKQPAIPKRKRRPAKKSKGKGREKKAKKEHISLAMLKTQANKSAKGQVKYMRYLRKNWQPSAKVTKCVELLDQFQRDGQKTIIFSQFVSLLDLLQVPIEQKGWAFERYDGSMSAEARNNAILRFTDKPDNKIMLISLKAGNSGLNLVAASRVIILDPFWNPFIEMQAIDRAHRIGQQKAVEVHRILIEGTVEDRIIELQRQKKEMVDAALDEGARKSFAKLGVQALAFLFGVGSHP